MSLAVRTFEMLEKSVERTDISTVTNTVKCLVFTVESDLIVTELFAFLSTSSINQNVNDLKIAIPQMGRGLLYMV